MSEEKTEHVFEGWMGVLTDIGAIGKDSKNDGQGFKYRGVDAVMNAVHPLLARHKVFLLPEILSDKSEERQTKHGATLIYRVLSVRFSVVSGIDGSRFWGTVIGEGMDSGDKASNKAMAVALKYFVCQSLCLPYDEVDPDGESHKVTSKPDAVAAPTAHPPAQKITRVDESGCTDDEIIFVSIAVRQGKKKDGSAWTLTSGKGQDGIWYGTFDTKFRDLMTASTTNGKPVMVKSKPGRTEGNRDIVDMATEAPAPVKVMSPSMPCDGDGAPLVGPGEDAPF